MPRKVVHALWPPTIDSPPSYLPLPDSLTPCLTPSLFSLSLSVSLPLSLSVSLCVSLSLSLSVSVSVSLSETEPCGRGGLWPPTIWYRFACSLSPAIPSLPPSLWYRFAYSLSPAIPSLPRDFALLQAFGLRRRPSPLTGLWQQRSLLSPPSLPPSLPGDFALLQAFGVGLRPSA